MNRNVILIIALFSFFCVAPQAGASSSSQDNQPYNSITGLEWLEMSGGERVDNLMAAMYLLNKNGVELSYSVDHYYDAIYRKLQQAPALYSSRLDDILASYVYEKEPKSRALLDQLRNKTR